MNTDTLFAGVTMELYGLECGKVEGKLKDNRGRMGNPCTTVPGNSKDQADLKEINKIKSNQILWLENLRWKGERIDFWP